MQTDKTIFLSYCWKDEEIANEIDNYFKSIGMNLKRDKRGVSYVESIKNFMKSIRETDFVINIYTNINFDT